jgi:cellulose synthase/poly-beta-1,6-N-acetylglucosamine synthase-like glycosyltransferase
LLIAAHNEELVIEGTIRSAIKSGQDPKHIYVVDDNSTDDTSKIASGIIGKKNVLRVGRSGKGLALTKAAHHFDLAGRYRWIHIADADGGFARDYFKIFRKNLNVKYAAATGYVRSLPGSHIGQYRVFEYTLGMEIHRRFQSMAHTISVIPGPTSCFRSDVFAKVNFANKSLTEDFDVTLQIHRKKLGNILFIPDAVAYTQDPRNIRDFTKQITRWNRGVMQGVRRHKIGFRWSRIDAYLSYQVMMNFLLVFNYLVVLPIAIHRTHSLDVIATAFLFDVGLMFALTFLTAMKANRKDIISAFPQIYLYRWITLFVFLRAFIEVVVFRKFRATEGIWGTAGRRYKNTVELG